MTRRREIPEAADAFGPNEHMPLPVEWGAVLGDDILATAILDRLLHHCEVLPINGPSYRLRNRMNLIPGADMTS